MKRLAIVVTVFALVFGVVFTVLALGPAPSWQLNAGAPNSCVVSAVLLLPGVEINVPVGQASERGVLSAPGYPNLGVTNDSVFGPFVGPSSFLVFASAPYSLPANTPLTLSVTTYNGPSYTGGVSYVSTITWDCTTGAVIAQPVEVAPNCPIPLPEGSVMGQAPLGAAVYWAPAADKGSPDIVLPAGTYWVVGVDETGEYSKIWLTCNSEFWVRSDTLQPSYEAPWSGQPLPTRMVD